MSKTLYGAGFYHSKDGLTWPEYLHEKLKTEWSLSPTCRENCECYFLRHWSKKYFMEHEAFDPASMTINYNGQEYNMIFHGDFTPGNQCALSFRVPRAELNLPAYVLVKGIAS